LRFRIHGTVNSARDTHGRPGQHVRFQRNVHERRSAAYHSRERWARSRHESRAALAAGDWGFGI